MTLDLEHFRHLLYQATARSLDEVHQAFANEHVYGISLVVDREGGSVQLFAQSELGLERTVAKEIEKGGWVAKSGDLKSLIGATYRWDFSTEWRCFEAPFSAANRWLLDSDPLTFCRAGITRYVFLCCLGTLAALDAEGLFGTGKLRESIVLNLYVGDQSDEDLVSWASQVNPYEVYTRFAKELQNARTASRELRFIGRE